MRVSALVLAFLPLIVFSALARILPARQFGYAALAGTAAALLALAVERPRRPPKILTAGSLVLFSLLTVLGFSLGHDGRSWLATWGAPGVGIVLGLVVLALIPVIPFTEQFARQSVPSKEWHSPTFRRINRVLSTGWGLAITGLGVSRVIAAAVDARGAEVLFGAVVPVLLIIGMLHFSRTYPDSVTHGDRSIAVRGHR